MEARRLLSGILTVVIMFTMLCSCLRVEMFATSEDCSSIENQPAEDPFQHQLEEVFEDELEEVLEYQYEEVFEYQPEETVEYQPIIDFDTVAGNLTSITVEYSPALLYSGFGNYTSVEEAAVAVRDNLRNHVNNFTVYVESTSSDYKEVYTQLLYAAEVHTGNPVEGDYLVWQTGSMDLFIYLTKANGLNYFKMNFIVPYYTTVEQEAELDMAVNAVLNSLNLYNASDYEKLKGIYDYICQNVTYDYAHSNDPTYTMKHSAYAALINKTAVCQGYALLFYRFALSLGIDARIVGGTANGGAHDWNVVRLGGKYYNLDATWDAGRTNYKYFLKSDENFSDHVRYAEYTADRFLNKHPMTTQDYYESEFTIIDGSLVSYNGMGGEVVIPDGVTEIAEGAFRNKTNVTSVVIPKTVTTIGANAFSMCSLNSVVIPTNVAYIGDGAFNCNLSKITLNSPNTFISGSFGTLGYGAVVCGHAGSTAQTYASMYGSTFEEFSDINGDLDGNGVVNNNDAIYLLYSVIFGTQEYPVDQDCDYNNDGVVDNKDASYLLYHTVFGADDYPI